MADAADVLLLDVSMPGPGVIELIRRPRARTPRPRILVLSVHPERQYARRVFQAGADGYLTKNESPGVLANAIRQVYAGRKYIAHSLAEDMALDLAEGRAGAAHEALSDREHEVRVRLESGAAANEIAQQLGLSPKSVRTYRSRILEKMNLKSTAQIIATTGRARSGSRGATRPHPPIRRAAALAVSVSILLALALARWAAPAEEDLTEIHARGALRVITHLTADDAQFSSHNPSRPGLDLEILNGFASLEKVRIEIVEVGGGPDPRVAALVEGKGDVVAGRLSVTAERSRRIAFSAEVFPLRFVILTRHPSPAVATSAELRSYRVGTVGTSEGLMRAVKEAQVPPSQVDATFKEPSDMLEGLRSGRVTAIITGLDEALTAQRKDPDFRVGGFVGAPTSFVLGLRKEDAALRTALDAYIGNLRRTTTWNRLVVKYFGDKALDILRAGRPASPP